MNIIETLGLTKRFGAKQIVHHCDLTISHGELFGLIGGDGAGKTTLLRMLATVMRPTSGEAWVLGHSIRTSSSLIQEELGYMPQKFGLFEELTIFENLRFIADLYGLSKKNRSARIEELLAFTHLEECADRQAGKISGGMKQKLALACTLIHQPKIIILDEPTNGVDITARRDFWHILYELSRSGVTILVSTSYLDEAERCSHIALMHEGTLLVTGTPKEMKQLYKRTILEVECEYPTMVQKEISQLLPQERVYLRGHRIHVSTKELSIVMQEIQQFFQRTGQSLYNISEVEPDLDDVMIDLLMKKAL